MNKNPANKLLSLLLCMSLSLGGTCSFAAYAEENGETLSNQAKELEAAAPSDGTGDPQTKVEDTKAQQSEEVTASGGVIISFEALDPPVSAQKLTLGGDNTPNLPQELTATVESADGNINTSVPVTGWHSEPELDTQIAGTYVHSPLFSGEWILTDGAAAPVITVVVAAKNATMRNGSGLRASTGIIIYLDDTDAELMSAAALSSGKWSYDDTTKVVTIYDGASVTITGSTADRQVKVATGAAVTITLNNANITLSGDYQYALDMSSAGACTVELAANSSNILKSGYNSPGIFIPNGNKVTINGTGKLSATGGDFCPGIGRNGDGNIEIEGGDITAQGGYGAAGIGGSANTSGGTITISGGTVKAIGGIGGAGIGGGGTGSFGKGGAGGDITISGGSVTATASSGAGIGGGSGDNLQVADVTIEGGASVNCTVNGIGASSLSLGKCNIPSGSWGGVDLSGTYSNLTVNNGTATLTSGDTWPTYWQAGVAKSYIWLALTYTGSLSAGQEAIWTVNSGDVSSIKNRVFFMPSEDVEITGTARTAAAISVSTTGLDNLKVGAPVNGTITFTLTGANYADSVKALNFTIFDLSDGLAAGTAVRTSTTEVTVTITGTPTAVNASPVTLTLPSSISADNLEGSANDITPTGSITVGPVAKGDPSYTAPNGLTATYGETLNDVSLSNGEGDGTWSWADAGATSVGDVGSKTFNVTFTPRDTNYNEVTGVAVTINVSPKQLTWSAVTVNNKTYDGTTSAVVSNQPTLSGIINNDDVTFTAGKATFTDVNVGEGKPVTFSGYTLSGKKANNYTLAAQPPDATADITKATLTITGFSISKSYDGNDDVDVTNGFGNLQFSGLQNNETANVVTTGVTATYNNANAETGKAITFVGNFSMTGGNADPNNYSITQPVGIIGEITKAELTIEGFNISKTYEGSDVVDVENGFSSLVFTGLADGETASVVTTGVTATYDNANAATGKAITFIGNFSMTGGNANPNNYSITQPSGITGSITPKSIAITGFAISKTYDGKNSIAALGNLEFVGLVIGEDATVDSSNVKATYDDADAGNNKPIAFSGNFTMTGNGANPNNYSITQLSDITGEITPKSITITDFAISKTYDGNDEVKNGFGNLKFVGLENGETAKVDSSNVEATYDNVNANTGIDITFAGKFTMTDGNAKPDNYSITQPTGITGEITKAVLTIEGLAISKTYDGDAHVKDGFGDLYLSGLQNNEIAKVDIAGVTSATYDSANVGTGIDITFVGNFSMTGVTASSSNYYITQPTVTGNIVKADITIVADDKYADFAAVEPTYTYTVSGLAPGEELKVEPVLSSDADMNRVGGYTIKASGAEVLNTDNYSDTITYVDGTLTVEHVYVTIRFNAGIGNGEMADVKVPRDVEYTLPDSSFKLNSYAFGGWRLNDAGDAYEAGDSVIIYGDTTLYAQWTLLPSGDDGPYNVTFNTNGGTAISSVTSGVNSTVFLSNYTTTRSGYSFEGWYSDTSLTKPITSVLINGNTTVYAKWTEDSASSSSTTDADSLDSWRTNADISDSSSATDISADSDANANPDNPQSADAASTTNNAYISGYSDGTFRPDSNITRAEVAQMIYDISGANDIGQGAEFRDVTDDSWYFTPVTYLADAGIISGYADGTFKPKGNITRAEFITMVVKYAALTYNGEVSFSDVSEEHWAYEYIAAAELAGYIGGYEDGSFHPDGALTRAETVAILNTMLGRKVDKNALEDLTMPFVDVPETHWAYYQILAAAADNE